MEQGDDCLKQLLTCMKHTVTSRKHVNFIVDAILRFDDDDKYNLHTIATILSFIAICYASQLAQSTKSAIYAKLVTFLEKNKSGEQHYICQLGATAMRVAQKQGDEDEANCTCLNSFNN